MEGVDYYKIMNLKTLKEEVYNHLTTKIIPFWQRLIDKENGGYIGYVGFDLKPDIYAPKSLILTSRILWFFSASYNQLNDTSLLNYALHAYKFLTEKFWDSQNGGFYWMVNYKGEPIDRRKHIYGQAFSIYALSEYYKATKDNQSLDLAIQTYKIIEEKCKDEYAYKEEFDQEWTLMPNKILSEYGVTCEKSMNSILHIMEAYSNLFEVWQDYMLKKNLENILYIFKTKIFDPQNNHLKVFFDHKMESIIDAISYGHDIEATWLIDEALKHIEDVSLRTELKNITLKISETILEEAFENGSLLNEKVRGVLNKDRIWWAQAEALVGFLNAYEKSNNSKFYNAVIEIWEFIKNFLVDKRSEGEWFWKLDEDYIPAPMPIVEPWKCPYHNGRMCLEVLKRI